MMPKFLYFIKYFLPFSILFFLLQYFIVNSISNKYNFHLNTINIYLFHFIITLFIYLFLIFVNKNYFDKTGFAFLATSILKMMASIIFLIPLIQSKSINLIPDVFAFFIPYFLFLTFETFFAIRLINNP